MEGIIATCGSCHDAEMFSKNGKFAVDGFVTLDFACLNCHKNKNRAWLHQRQRGCMAGSNSH